MRYSLFCINGRKNPWIFHRCKWIQSGVLVRNSALDCRDGGVRVQVPFFQPINPTEEIIESTSDWGTSGEGYLTPQNITAAVKS